MSNALGQMSQLSIFQAHYSLITNQFSVFIRTSLLASHLHRHATMAQNSRADSLERRLVQFAIDIVTLVVQFRALGGGEHSKVRRIDEPNRHCLINPTGDLCS